MTTEEHPLYETMGRTVKVTIKPSTLHLLDIQENEYLHGYKTSNEGLESISIEERELDDYQRTIRITNNDPDYLRTVVLFIRKGYPT